MVSRAAVGRCCLRPWRRPRSEHSDLFHFAAIRKYAQLHLDRKINVGYHLWGLLMLFLWMKRWKIQSSPSLASKQEKPGFQVLAVER